MIIKIQLEKPTDVNVLKTTYQVASSANFGTIIADVTVSNENELFNKEIWVPSIYPVGTAIYGRTKFLTDNGWTVWTMVNKFTTVTSVNEEMPPIPQYCFNLPNIQIFELNSNNTAYSSITSLDNVPISGLVFSLADGVNGTVTGSTPQGIPGTCGVNIAGEWLYNQNENNNTQYNYSPNFQKSTLPIMAQNIRMFLLDINNIVITELKQIANNQWSLGNLTLENNTYYQISCVNISKTSSLTSQPMNLFFTTAPKVCDYFTIYSPGQELYSSTVNNYADNSPSIVYGDTNTYGDTVSLDFPIIFWSKDKSKAVEISIHDSNSTQLWSDSQMAWLNNGTTTVYAPYSVLTVDNIYTLTLKSIYGSYSMKFWYKNKPSVSPDGNIAQLTN